MNSFLTDWCTLFQIRIVKNYAKISLSHPLLLTWEETQSKRLWLRILAPDTGWTFFTYMFGLNYAQRLNEATRSLLETKGF